MWIIQEKSKNSETDIKLYFYYRTPLVAQWMRASASQCRGHGFDPWSRKILHALEQLSPWATSTEARLRSTRGDAAAMRSPGTAGGRRPHSPQSKEDPVQAKIKIDYSLWISPQLYGQGLYQILKKICSSAQNRTGHSFGNNKFWLGQTETGQASTHSQSQWFRGFTGSREYSVFFF